MKEIAKLDHRIELWVKSKHKVKTVASNNQTVKSLTLLCTFFYTLSVYHEWNFDQNFKLPQINSHFVNIVLILIR